ncbi:hypothetical protein [Mycolicibacterium sp. XJ879]
MESDLAVWIAQLPDFKLRRPCGGDGGGDGCFPLANPSELSGSEVTVFDHLRPDSFVRLVEFPALACRDMPAVAAATQGQVVGRVLRSDPARPWPQPPWRRRTRGFRLNLLVAGTAWFDLDGIGEESFSANDSWCLPGGIDYALLEASTDFELLEIEFLGAPGYRTTAIPEMVTLFATYSYRQPTIFGERTEVTESPSAAAPLVKLDDRAHDGWARPWHLQEQGIQCAYLTRGAAKLELKGRSAVDARAGTFWVQQARSAVSESRQKIS